MVFFFLINIYIYIYTFQANEGKKNQTFLRDTNN